MPQIAFHCPHCEALVRAETMAGPSPVVCPECDDMLGLRVPQYEEGRLGRCLVCPSRDLFVRKDFPPRLGVAIVVAGFAASCVSWAFHYVLITFAILFATALLDVILYWIMGDVLECYGCHAQYRGVAGLEGHEAFSLEVHERHRQQRLRRDEIGRVRPAG
jgi:hypothetical protein